MKNILARVKQKHWLVVFVALLCVPSAFAQAASDTALKLEVIEPYIEMRSGPGRGYPVFYVIEQGDWVEVLVKRAGWYEVRAEDGKVGWATSAQLSRTLKPSGEPIDLPTVSFGDYLKDQWRVGFVRGKFTSGELKTADTFSATLSYRFLSWLGVEAEAGKIFGSTQEGRVWNTNVLIEPFSRWRFSPEFLVGRGSMSLESHSSPAPLALDGADFTNYGVGLNYYLGRNLVMQTQFRRYSVLTNNNKVNLETWKIGFNTFF